MILNIFNVKRQTLTLFLLPNCNDSPAFSYEENLTFD